MTCLASPSVDRRHALQRLRFVIYRCQAPFRIGYYLRHAPNCLAEADSLGFSVEGFYDKKARNSFSFDGWAPADGGMETQDIQCMTSRVEDVREGSRPSPGRVLTSFIAWYAALLSLIACLQSCLRWDAEGVTIPD